MLITGEGFFQHSLILVGFSLVIPGVHRAGIDLERLLVTLERFGFPSQLGEDESFIQPRTIGARGDSQGPVKALQGRFFLAHSSKRRTLVEDLPNLQFAGRQRGNFFSIFLQKNRRQLIFQNGKIGKPLVGILRKASHCQLR